MKGELSVEKSMASHLKGERLCGIKRSDVKKKRREVNVS